MAVPKVRLTTKDDALLCSGPLDLDLAEQTRLEMSTYTDRLLRNLVVFFLFFVLVLLLKHSFIVLLPSFFLVSLKGVTAFACYG